MESRCKCCLKNGRHKDLWAEYVSDGEVEIYGEMLKECFQFSWSKLEDYLEQICDRCIKKLRMSLDFRRDILSSAEAWTGFLDDVSQDNDQLLAVKSEAVESYDIIIEEYECQGEDPENAEYYVEHTKKEESIDDEKDDEAEYLSCDLEEESPESQMEVEYLEDVDEKEGKPIKTEQPDTSKTGKKHKYKQYSQTDLEKALEMVANNVLTRSEAALKYNVPVKTLGFKIRAKETEDSTPPDTESKGKQNKFYEEIRTILTYTNATPYKTKVGRLYCAYCSTEGPMFETSVDLRSHTRKEHCNERLRNVEVFMRPNYLNEVIKIDIKNFRCNVCECQINSWNSMFEHLKEKHDVELDLAYTKVIPYVLDEDNICCCLCNQKFSHFHMLDVHMNTHYNNYICGECGDTFLSETRLKKHVETHSTKRYPCTFCGKTFTLEKYRKKHMDGVHLKELKFKCLYCKEIFSQDYSRHLHVLAAHNEKIKVFQCEYCEHNFTWRPYFLKHMRLNHMRPDKKFFCKLCPKKFHIKSELKHHEDWHSGKGYTCTVCQKKFSSKNYLQKHSSVHNNETEQVENTEELIEYRVEEVVLGE